MTPGTPVRHRETGKTGHVRYTYGALVFVSWRDPLTSGRLCVRPEELEPIFWPDNPVEAEG